MKHKRPIIVAGAILLAVMLAALPFVSACAPKEKTLKIGITTPSTGAAAEKGSPMGHGNLDAIEYINTELGGVAGYPVEAVWLDNGYDAAKVVTNVKKFMDDGCLLFATSSSKMMSATMEIANRAEFPGLVCFNAPVLHRPPQHIYGQMPDYGDDWAAFAAYYMENIWKGPGKPRMALHLLNNTTGYGALDAAKASAERLGIELLLPAAEHTPTTTSEIDSLTRIKTLNPDILYISSTPAPTAVIIKNAFELGLYPGVTIGLGHAGITKALVDIAGADIVEGVYGVFPTVNWGDDVPGMAKAVEYCRKLHPKDEGNLDYITSWAQSMIMAEILRLTVENVGYDVLAKGDVESWRAIETYGIQRLNYDVGGLHGPATYTPGDNRLSKSVRIFQIQSGEINPVTDWVEAPLVKYEEFEWFGK
ncbi:MAG TPA: ABC transporter substrate-binding protein [Dehalococcoidales bacterium]|nr:ABC transporter substrate-binding protein [Dehalococcoidales bacterium]